ncbi:protein-export chaperone SecB [Pontixanthobacter aquaemixtae]|uniref:Protein-export protein SecB n=1 Tax=Pontixanthobacter aquaemixtae TaxID=1958940 RepID=A0A844ZYE2_9SPHN|nr:protein-export chaperone SecB [Pontixanthobacter aquaemixtae]MXO91757.1 protein-export chaperone SecB [Pontixanthobacter aquaemixtae]
MADEGDVLTDLDMDPVPNGEDTAPVAGIISQYVKDLSVENPNAPDSFQWSEKPHIDLQFNIGAREVSDEIQEVELKINVTSKTEQGNVFLVELAYCGLLGMRNMPDDRKHAFMFAEAPRLLFPFARSIIADATRDAGFAPLMLDPVDFNGLYMQQLQQKAEQEAAAGGGADAPAGEA